MLKNFVLEKPEYSTSRARAADVFRLDSTKLPDQVFRENFTNFRFVEFDLTLTGRFWPFLRNLAEIFEDRHVWTLVIDPHPEDYYFKHFRRYAALKFPIQGQEDDYSAALREEPKDSTSDALVYVVSTIVWYGESGRWGIWGERDLGVAVGGCAGARIVWPQSSGIHLFELDSALSNLVALNFPRRIVPPKFVTTLRSNYLK